MVVFALGGTAAGGGGRGGGDTGPEVRDGAAKGGEGGDVFVEGRAVVALVALAPVVVVVGVVAVSVSA